MMLQLVADGLILGATVSLGAIGLTLTYSILRFANFTHGELITCGAYVVLAALAALAGVVHGPGRIGALSFGWPLLLALLLAVLLTGALALLLDWLLFRRLRRHGSAIAMVIASFGASLAVRNLIVFAFGPQPDYFTRELQIAIPVLPGVRVTPDQLFVLGLAAALVAALHLFLTRTMLGRAMRASAENPTLAMLTGIDVHAVVRWTWLIGGGLAAVAGVFLGLTVQVRPSMGFDLLLPLFAAAILGGIGSPYGAVLGGLVIGLAESLSVPLVGSEYRQAVGFLVMLAMLLWRPQGLLGERT
ncbi:MAG: branched-chain amino acid ABC transporter permease [Rhodospirillaceae bacterium]|nr:branched-chain amino acid ABC transporter permease [Rhodospirillaceae bacterium]